MGIHKWENVFYIPMEQCLDIKTHFSYNRLIMWLVYGPWCTMRINPISYQIDLEMVFLVWNSLCWSERDCMCVSEGVCMRACLSIYTMETPACWINTSFTLCPQIKAKNYDKVEKVSANHTKVPSHWPYRGLRLPWLVDSKGGSTSLSLDGNQHGSDSSSVALNNWRSQLSNL